MSLPVDGSQTPGLEGGRIHNICGTGGPLNGMLGWGWVSKWHGFPGGNNLAFEDNVLRFFDGKGGAFDVVGVPLDSIRTSPITYKFIK